MRAGILLRISDDREGEGLGVARQDKDCRGLAKRMDATVVEVYRENDTSAFKRRKVVLPDGTTALRVLRPEFRRALADLAAGRIDLLIVYDLDRVARDPRDLEDLIDVVESRHVRAVSVTGSLDLSNDSGITMARVMVAVANKASRDQSRRIRRKYVEIAEAGKVGNGGYRPFGYTKDRLQLVPEEAEALRGAYDAFLAGRTLRAICHELTSQGLLSTQGRPWSTPALRNNLLTGRNAGLREHHGEIVADAVWPAIVDRETWEKVRAILLSRGGYQGDYDGTRKYLLSGFLRCGLCQQPLRPRRTSQTQRFGCLATKDGGCGRILIRYEPLEEWVVPVLLTHLEEQAELEPEVPEDRSTQLLTQITADEARLTVLAEAFADDEDANPLELRLAGAKIRRRIAETREMLALEHRAAVTADPLEVREAWLAGKYDLAQKRAVVASLIDHIAVGPGRPGVNRFQEERITTLPGRIAWR